jgi:hypothetical protein
VEAQAIETTVEKLVKHIVASHGAGYKKHEEL